MPTPSTFVMSLTIGTDVYSKTVTNTSDVEQNATPTVPAAKTGALTTRTNNTDGTLTMDAGHGFTTAAVIDLFWVGGSRRNVTVGTVSGNSVPISGGSGDNLPVNNTPITAMLPVQVAFSVVGDNLEALGSFCPVNGWVVYRDGTTVRLAHQIRANVGSEVWAAGSGVTNPLATFTVTNVLFSHSDSTQALTMKAGVVH